MNSSSDEESEVSESEIDVYCEKPYGLLKNGHYKVKEKGLFRCPFCAGKKKQHYKYKELFAHASGVAKGSASRNAKQRANHLALAKYLENELAGDADVPLKQNSLSSSKQPPADGSDIYVSPWMGIVIIPFRRNDDKDKLLDSAYWLKKLAKFEPVEVKTIWIEQDSVVAVIPKFNSAMSGFKNATELEREYEVKRCSKKDWSDKRGDWRSKTYGWCARADDYNSQGLIAEYLSSVGELKNFSDIAKEETQKANIVVEDLANKIAMTNEDLNKVQYRNNWNETSMHKVLVEKEALDRKYKEESKKMQKLSRVHIDNILKEKERLSNRLEYKVKKLKEWSKELDKKEALTELERQNLDEEKKKTNEMNNSLHLASMEQKRADDRILRLVEEHKRQKEENYNRIYELEKELDKKQKLQMDIQERKGKLQVIKQEEDEEDEGVKERMEELNSEIRDLEDMNQALMVKERQSNDEILEARELLITGLRDLLTERNLIRIKRMGELDEKPFAKACKQRFKGEEADVQHAMLCSKWQEVLKDSTWHPYKHVGTGEKMKEVVDEEDKQLKELKEEWGEEVMNAVKTALEELNEYNPSGRYSVPVLWNFKEQRKASLKEVINYMFKQIKALRGKQTK